MEKPASLPSALPREVKATPGKPEVIFNENQCKGCELCVSVCPKKILKLDTSRVNIRGYFPSTIYNPEECIGCANCAKMCPDSVITVRK
jgi:2-oxoglutarate ferredoxin oxidoreductase subunit delta